MPRCCPTHPDWPTLSEHLLVAFQGVPVGEFVREVRAAKSAVSAVGLSPEDELVVGELIARHQLMLLSGQADDVARLDPETHVRAMPAT